MQPVKPIFELNANFASRRVNMATEQSKQSSSTAGQRKPDPSTYASYPEYVEAMVASWRKWLEAAGRYDCRIRDAERKLAPAHLEAVKTRMALMTGEATVIKPCSTSASLPGCAPQSWSVCVLTTSNSTVRTPVSWSEEKAEANVVFSFGRRQRGHFGLGWLSVGPFPLQHFS